MKIVKRCWPAAARRFTFRENGGGGELPRTSPESLSFLRAVYPTATDQEIADLFPTLAPRVRVKPGTSRKPGGRPTARRRMRSGKIDELVNSQINIFSNGKGKSSIGKAPESRGLRRT